MQIQADTISPTTPKAFNAYPFIIAIMSCLQIICTLYARYFVGYNGFDVPIGTLIFTPMILYIFQIVAECYGWQYARQIVWCNFFVNGLFTICTFIMKFIPLSLFTHEDLRYSYTHLLDTIWVSSLMLWVTIFFADYISTVLTCIFRLRTKGKFILIRILSIHLASESILISSGLITMPYNGYSWHETLAFMQHIFIGRSIVSLIMSPIAYGCIWFIQNLVEQVVTFDLGKDKWTLFAWRLKDNYRVHFNAQEWKRLNPEIKRKINIIELAENHNAKYAYIKIQID